MPNTVGSAPRGSRALCQGLPQLSVGANASTARCGPRQRKVGESGTPASPLGCTRLPGQYTQAANKPLESHEKTEAGGIPVMVEHLAEDFHPGKLTPCSGCCAMRQSLDAGACSPGSEKKDRRESKKEPDPAASESAKARRTGETAPKQAGFV